VSGGVATEHKAVPSSIRNYRILLGRQQLAEAGRRLCGVVLLVRCGRVVGRRAGYRNALAERHSGGRAMRPPSFVMKL
jgi:hypothetical protein